MRDNYQSAGEHIRNLADLTVPYEVLETDGRFRIVQIAPPYYSGFQLWIVNEKGFFWEPAANLDKALAYLGSDEAKEYQAGP